MSQEKQKKSSKRTSKKLRKRRKIVVALLSVLSIFILGIIYFVCTKPGQEQVVNIASDYIYDKSLQSDSEESNFKKKENDSESNLPEHLKIVLLGSQDSNTDTMIVASLNTKDNTLSLTSLMRDIYVDIPDHHSAKLNAAYPMGGIDLFYQTIQQNFNQTFDGYVLVDYDTFEYIIDQIGGVEITLTEAEAKYLNTTNYISDKKQRTVVPGTQTLTGNQALGYCRIRYRATVDGENDDFGRTARQRTVLNAIFKKVKSKDILDLIGIANNVLNNSKIKTDITKSDFRILTNALLKVDAKDITTHRIPTAGSFEDDYRTIKEGSKPQKVLIMKDWNQTRTELSEFINESTDTH